MSTIKGRSGDTTPAAVVMGMRAPQMPEFAPAINFTDPRLETEDYRRSKNQLVEALVDRIDFRVLEGLSRDAKRSRVSGIIESYIQNEIRIPLTAQQQVLLKEQVLDDLLGFGPLELLLADPEVSDIMVNGCNQIYIERGGKIFLSDVK